MPKIVYLTILLVILFGGVSCISKDIASEQSNLESEYPNPFCSCPNLDILFNVDKEQEVLILLLNNESERMDTLFSGKFTTGKNIITPQFSNLNSGGYFYKFIGIDTTYIKRFTLVK